MNRLLCWLFGHKTGVSSWGSQVNYCSRCDTHYLEIKTRGR